jgi:RHS repeat-associated protein
VEVYNQRGERHTYKADALGRVTQQEYFDGHTEEFEYDTRDNLIAIRYANGHVVRMTHDVDGNLLRKVYPDGTSLNIRYDSLGRMTRAVCPGSIVERTMDAHGNVVREVQNGIVLSSRYDNTDNRLALTVPGFGERQYYYDKRARVTRMEAMGITLEYEYDNLGRLTLESLPSGISRTWSYDDPNRTVMEKVRDVSGSSFLQRTFIHDAEGNPVRIFQGEGSHKALEYDALQHITTVSENGRLLERYEYDERGNIIANVSGRFQYASGNRLTTAPGASLNYGAEGNVAEIISDVAVRRLTFDDEFQLLRVADSPGQTTKYQYDALGRRIAKVNDNSQIRFIWDGSTLLLEEDAHAATEFLFRPDSFFPVAERGAGGTYVYLTKRVALPTELVDVSNRGSLSLDYSSFGASVSSSEVYARNPFRFAGQYYDVETGFHYNRCRYYSPALGRYIGADPLGIFGGLNTYQYALNPLRWADPYGLSEEQAASLPHYMDLARDRGVDRAWAEERDALRAGEEGSREWTEEEEEIIKSGERPPGWEGHHQKSVKYYYGKCQKITHKCKKKQADLRRKCRERAKKLAEDPDNIQFLRNGEERAGREGMEEENEHIDAHNGNFCNATHGPYDVEM